MVYSYICPAAFVYANIGQEYVLLAVVNWVGVPTFSQAPPITRLCNWISTGFFGPSTQVLVKFAFT